MARNRRTLLAGLSIGVVFLLVLLFLFTQADALFPGKADAYRTQIGVYAVALALVVGLNALSDKRNERPLFTTGFFTFKGLGKLAIFTIITIAVMFLVGTIIGTGALPRVREAISTIGVGVILVHVFVVAFVEEQIFRNFLVNELKARRVGTISVIIFQALAFAFFHWGISGGEILLLVPYIPLGLLFYFVRERYSPQTQTANTGVHAGWNVFILGFLR